MKVFWIVLFFIVLNLWFAGLYFIILNWNFSIPLILVVLNYFLLMVGFQIFVLHKIWP